MTFSLNPKESEQAKKWLKQHVCKFCDPENQGAIGGRVTYCFTPTGIGDLVKIECSCGEYIDVTDFDEW